MQPTLLNGSLLSFLSKLVAPILIFSFTCVSAHGNSSFGVSFDKILDDTTPVPDGTGAFLFFGGRLQLFLAQISLYQTDK